MYQVQQINGRELAAILSTHKTIAAAVKACRSADRKPHGNLVRFDVARVDGGGLSEGEKNALLDAWGNT